MAVMVLDRGFAETVLSLKSSESEDRLREEVWDGVTFIMPEADNAHDRIASFFHGVFWTIFVGNADYVLHFRVNISDRQRDWKKNYRTPDMALFSAHGPEIDCGTFWCGGPIVALEVAIPCPPLNETFPLVRGFGMLSRRGCSHTFWSATDGTMPYHSI